MKSGIRLLPILLFVFVGPSPALANDCQNIVAPDSNLQQILQAQEQAIHALIEAYGQRLGVFQNPFAVAFNAEQGERIFRRLSVRAKDGKWVNSSLGLINLTLKKSYLQQRHYSQKLVRWIIKDSEYWLQAQKVEQADLQANLLALKYSLEYLRRYKEPEVVVDRDGKKEESKAQEGQAQRQKQIQADDPPEYPDLPKEYRPSTKDTQSQSGGKQKRHRIAEASFKTPFFAQRYFAEIVRGAKTPFREVALPDTLPVPAKYQITDREEIVRTFGKRKVDLLLPPLHKPLQPSDPRAVVSRSESGGYVLELKDDLQEVQIPLVDDADISLMPHVLEIYKRPVGFRAEEWPDLVQAELIRKFSLQDARENPLRVAQAIANHIATKYIYSVGPRSEADPIDALKAGAFQCDMAAYSMMGMLRDIYQIPSRAVGGFRAKNHQGGKDGKSYLIVPGEAHAWVEVFHEGRWHLFDPTPVKKDKKEGDGENEYSDNPLENAPKLAQEKENPSGKSRSQNQTQPIKEDHGKRLEEDTQRRTKDEKAGEKEKATSKENESPEEVLTKSELADQLEIGSLELEPRPDHNALLERVMRVLLQTALDPTKAGSDIQNRLNSISSLMRRFNSPQLREVHQKGLSAHSGEHPDLKNWIDRLLRMMPGQDVNRSYQELHRIRSALEAYAMVLDASGRIPLPEKLLAVLAEVQWHLEKLAHPDSQDIGLVQDLVKDLPWVARQLLKNEYGLTKVGSNSPTQEIARRLKSGKLNDLRLVSILSPLSEFILNSSPRPENIEVKTWQRDPRHPRGQDFLPAERFSDLPRSLMGQPAKSAEENMREGTAYVPIRRQKVPIPAGYGKEDSERITIVLYDTSGSMSGDPGRFQAGLISAFTAKALSDVSPSGRHRQRVVIVPFESEPGTPVKVTNTQEALDVLRNYQQKLKNTGGGTNIQKALLQAMSLIADAEKRSGEPLAAANIVLMTDGQAEVDMDKLLQARKAIDRQTPLQTMFISINQTNEKLIEFAMDSQRMGAERGFYREFTADHIKDILREADTLDLKGRHDFFTERSAKEVPQVVEQLMDQALRLAGEYSDRVFYGSQFLSARDHLQNLEKVRWLDVKHIDRPLEKWLIKIRQFVRHPVFQDRRVLERVVDDLVIHIEQLSGVPSNEMSDHEQEHLRHLVRHAAGLEDS